jgi:hypothetical protein
VVTSFVQAHSAPRARPLRAVGLGKQRQKTHGERKALQARRGVQHGIHLRSLPPEASKVVRALRRSKFHLGAALPEMRPKSLPQAAQQAGRSEVNGPALKDRNARQIVGQ